MKRLILAALLFAGAIAVSAANAQPSKEDNSLRIMSYNVRNGIGTDNVMDIGRVADAINRTAPDIVALQELDSAAVRTGGVFVAEEIAKRTLMHYTFGAAINFQGGKYGVGLLSREKPLGHSIIKLPRSKENRVFLLVEFEKYFIGSTHLGLEHSERMESVPIIADAVAGLSKPVFFAGDINATPDSPELEALAEYFTVISNTKQNTFPADKPDRCIDYIFSRKQDMDAFSLLRNGVVAEPIASDHRPIYADIRLKAAAAEVFRTKPYLQNPTGNGITVSWLTNVPTESWVEYWTGQDARSRKSTYVDGQMICNNTRHKIRLDGLVPGETYSYCVCSREITRYAAYSKDFGPVVRSEIYSFRIPSPDDTGFMAVILNDIHKNDAIIDSLAGILDGLNYDLVVFNGDCIDDAQNEAEAVRFLSYMCEGVNAQCVPVLFTRGNHEIRGAYSIELRDLLDYPGDRTYSAFNIGDTRFVLLDCGEDKPDNTPVYYGLNDFEGLRKDQAEFLRAEVKSKAFRKASRRVLIHHIPVYGMSADGYNPCLELWGGILEKAPFDICINGHMHRFAYHPAGSDEGNTYPVVIGGGNRVETATMMILDKKGGELKLMVLDTSGNVKLELEL